MFKDVIVGLVFLFTADGQLAMPPAVLTFQSLAQCEEVRRTAKQAAVAENQILEMACIRQEAWHDGSA